MSQPERGIEALQRVFDERTNQPFLVDAESGETHTYAETSASARRLATWLTENGVSSGDRVAVLQQNSITHVVSIFAIIEAGAVAVPINPSESSARIQTVLERSGTEHVLTTEQENEQAAIPETFDGDIHQLDVGSAESGSDSHDAYACIRPEPFGGLTPEQELAVVYTSGTTGEPKGIVVSVGKLLANGVAFLDAVQIEEGERFYNYLPMAYLGGLYNLLLIPALAGGSVVVDTAFDSGIALRFWRRVREYDVTVLWMIPSLMSSVLATDRRDENKEYARENITRTLAGTAPLPTAVQREFEERYGVSVLENYGLSETFFVSTERPEDETGGSVGRPLPNVDVRIEDDEILVNTPYGMEYYDDAQSGSRVQDDGWIQTGDTGRLEDGCLYIDGRKKELIIRGGMNVSPVEVENALLSHPAVEEAAVIGLEDEHSGEEIAAAVRATDVSAQELEQFCRDRLAAYQQPTDLTLVDEIPKTRTGKIKKEGLKTEFEENQ